MDRGGVRALCVWGSRAGSWESECCVWGLRAPSLEPRVVSSEFARCVRLIVCENHLKLGQLLVLFHVQSALVDRLEVRIKVRGGSG